MNPPLGFLLTFRTYGTWMHGDPRGSVDCQNNVYGAPRVPTDVCREARELVWMRDAPMVFNQAQRVIADAAIRDQCVFENWRLVEASVRGNHVHVVVAYANVTPERMAQRIKSRITRSLRQRGGIDRNRPVWAGGAGSRMYLWTEQDVADAALYVREYQDEPRT